MKRANATVSRSPPPSPRSVGAATTVPALSFLLPAGNNAQRSSNSRNASVTMGSRRNSAAPTRVEGSTRMVGRNSSTTTTVNTVAMLGGSSSALLSQGAALSQRQESTFMVSHRATAAVVGGSGRGGAAAGAGAFAGGVVTRGTVGFQRRTEVTVGGGGTRDSSSAFVAADKENAVQQQRGGGMGRRGSSSSIATAANVFERLASSTRASTAVVVGAKSSRPSSISPRPSSLLVSRQHQQPPSVSRRGSMNAAATAAIHTYAVVRSDLTINATVSATANGNGDGDGADDANNNAAHFPNASSSSRARERGVRMSVSPGTMQFFLDNQNNASVSRSVSNVGMGMMVASGDQPPEENGDAHGTADDVDDDPLAPLAAFYSVPPSLSRPADHRQRSMPPHHEQTASSSAVDCAVVSYANSRAVSAATAPSVEQERQRASSSAMMNSPAKGVAHLLSPAKGVTTVMRSVSPAAVSPMGEMEHPPQDDHHIAHTHNHTHAHAGQRHASLEEVRASLRAQRELLLPPRASAAGRGGGQQQLLDLSRPTEAMPTVALVDSAVTLDEISTGVEEGNISSIHTTSTRLNASEVEVGRDSAVVTGMLMEAPSSVDGGSAANDSALLLSMITPIRQQAPAADENDDATNAQFLAASLSPPPPPLPGASPNTCMLGSGDFDDNVGADTDDNINTVSPPAGHQSVPSHPFSSLAANHDSTSAAAHYDGDGHRREEDDEEGRLLSADRHQRGTVQGVGMVAEGGGRASSAFARPSVPYPPSSSSAVPPSAARDASEATTTVSTMDRFGDCQSTFVTPALGTVAAAHTSPAAATVHATPLLPNQQQHQQHQQHQQQQQHGSSGASNTSSLLTSSVSAAAPSASAAAIVGLSTPIHQTYALKSPIAVMHTEEGVGARHDDREGRRGADGGDDDASASLQRNMALLDAVSPLASQQQQGEHQQTEGDEKDPSDEGPIKGKKQRSVAAAAVAPTADVSPSTSSNSILAQAQRLLASMTALRQSTRRSTTATTAAHASHLGNLNLGSNNGVVAGAVRNPSSMSPSASPAPHHFYSPPTAGVVSSQMSDTASNAAANLSGVMMRPAAGRRGPAAAAVSPHHRAGDVVASRGASIAGLGGKRSRSSQRHDDNNLGGEEGGGARRDMTTVGRAGRSVSSPSAMFASPQVLPPPSHGPAMGDDGNSIEISNAALLLGCSPPRPVGGASHSHSHSHRQQPQLQQSEVGGRSASNASVLLRDRSYRASLMANANAVLQSAAAMRASMMAMETSSTAPHAEVGSDANDGDLPSSPSDGSGAFRRAGASPAPAAVGTALPPLRRASPSSMADVPRSLAADEDQRQHHHHHHPSPSPRLHHHDAPKSTAAIPPQQHGARVPVACAAAVDEASPAPCPAQQRADGTVVAAVYPLSTPVGILSVGRDGHHYDDADGDEALRRDGAASPACWPPSIATAVGLGEKRASGLTFAAAAEEKRQREMQQQQQLDDRGDDDFQRSTAPLRNALLAELPSALDDALKDVPTANGGSGSERSAAVSRPAAAQCTADDNDHSTNIGASVVADRSMTRMVCDDSVGGEEGPSAAANGTADGNASLLESSSSPLAVAARTTGRISFHPHHHTSHGDGDATAGAGRVGSSTSSLPPPPPLATPPLSLLGVLKHLPAELLVDPADEEVGSASPFLPTTSEVVAGSSASPSFARAATSIGVVVPPSLSKGRPSSSATAGGSRSHTSGRVTVDVTQFCTTTSSSAVPLTMPPAADSSSCNAGDSTCSREGNVGNVAAATMSSASRLRYSASAPPIAPPTTTSSTLPCDDDGDDDAAPSSALMQHLAADVEGGDDAGGVGDGPLPLLPQQQRASHALRSGPFVPSASPAPHFVGGGTMVGTAGATPSNGDDADYGHGPSNAEELPRPITPTDAAVAASSFSDAVDVELLRFGLGDLSRSASRSPQRRPLPTGTTTAVAPINTCTPSTTAAVESPTARREQAPTAYSQPSEQPQRREMETQTEPMDWCVCHDCGGVRGGTDVRHRRRSGGKRSSRSDTESDAPRRRSRGAMSSSPNGIITCASGSNLISTLSTRREVDKLLVMAPREAREACLNFLVTPSVEEAPAPALLPQAEADNVDTCGMATSHSPDARGGASLSSGHHARHVAIVEQPHAVAGAAVPTPTPFSADPSRPTVTTVDGRTIITQSLADGVERSGLMARAHSRPRKYTNVAMWEDFVLVESLPRNFDVDEAAPRRGSQRAAAARGAVRGSGDSGGATAGTASSSSPRGSSLNATARGGARASGGDLSLATSGAEGRRSAGANKPSAASSSSATSRGSGNGHQ